MFNSKGYFLIECLIALALGFILMNTLIYAYLTQHTQLQQQRLLTTHTLEANAILSLLTNGIKQAGYIGCRKLTPTFMVDSSVKEMLTVHNKLTGKDHEFSVRYMHFPSVTLHQTMHNHFEMATEKQLSFAPHDFLFIADCKHAELFQLKNIIITKDYQLLIARTPLKYQYSTTAEVGKFIHQRFFLIGEQLYMENEKHIHRKIAEGIKQLNFRYAILKRDGIQFIPSSQVTQWEKVLGVKIELELVQMPKKMQWYRYASISI